MHLFCRSSIISKTVLCYKINATNIIIVMDYCSKISKNLFISDMPFDLASSNEKSKYFSTFFWVASKSFWVVL